MFIGNFLKLFMNRMNERNLNEFNCIQYIQWNIFSYKATLDDILT